MFYDFNAFHLIDDPGSLRYHKEATVDLLDSKAVSC